MAVEFLGTDGMTWLRLALWLALSAAIWLAWYGWFLSRGARALYAAVGAQLFSIVQIVLTEMAIGLAGILYAPLLVAVNIAAGGILIWCGVRPNRKEIFLNQRILFSNWRAEKKAPAAVFIVIAFLAITIWNIFWGWFLPPRDWDSLAYHLPIMAAFYQAHAIFPIPSPSVWVRYYPIDGELLNLWALILVGIDKVIDLAFVPAYLGGAAAVYGLARQFGARRTYAIGGASVFGFAPGMLIQQVGTLNDALFASLVAMGIFLVVGAPWPAAKNRPIDIWLSAMAAGASSGLLVGVKFSGAVYAVGIWVLFGVVWVLQAKREPEKKLGRMGNREGALLLLASILLAVSLGGYPYIRNWVKDGNPITPFEVRIGSTEIFPGAKDMQDFVDWTTATSLVSKDNATKTVTVWFEPYGNVYDDTMGGLGPLWIVLGIPALLLWLFLCLRRRQLLELILAIILWACFLVTPTYWLPRYVFPILILGSIATAVTLEALTPWPRRFISAIVLFLAIFSVFNILAPYRVTAATGLRVLMKEDDQTRSGAQFILSADGGHFYEWVDQHTLDHPAVIVFGKQVLFPYSFYGTDIRNTVVVFLPHSESDWRDEIERSGAEFVCVSQITPNYGWMESLPAFQEAFREGNYVVFQRTS